MEEISALAAAETIAVLNSTDATMVAEIPYILIKGFEDKAKEYDGEIKLIEGVPLVEQNISEEARALLLILHREYWATEEEKESLDKTLIESENEFNKLESERLDPFKDSKKDLSDSEISTPEIETTSSSIEESESVDSSTVTALMEVPKKWYVRIFDRIVRFFRKK